MKKIHLNTPKLIKKVRSKNLEQDKKIKKFLFDNPAQNSNQQSSQSTIVGNNIVKVIIIFLFLTLFFTFINIKFNVYEKFSKLVLPKNKNYNNAYLNVVSSNIPVQIFLNQNNIGITPIKDYVAPPGNYIIKVTSTHPLISKNILNIPVTLVSKNLTLVQVQLGPTFRTSSYSVVYATPSTKKQLMIFTHKPGTKVYLDNQYIGDTPLSYNKINNKTKATLKLTQEGYLPMQIQLALHSHTTLHVEAKLHQIILKLPKKQNAHN